MHSFAEISHMYAKCGRFASSRLSNPPWKLSTNEIVKIGSQLQLAPSGARMAHAHFNSLPFACPAVLNFSTIPLARTFFSLPKRPLWQWRVVFLSRLGVTALDGLAKTKESDKV